MNVYRILFAMVLLTAVWQSCKHHPIFDPTDPIDTSTNPIDTTGTDTTGTGGIDTTGHPCSPDTIYFVNDIMPMLNTYCAMPGLGCHDVTSDEQDIVFTNYNTVMNGGEVDPFDPGNSKIYEVITKPASDDDHMPPPGNAQLDFDQIQMIYTWIMQGAQNNECNENYGSCDTSNMTYALDIQPIINGKCIGCHNNTNTSDGINLSTLQGIINAQNDNGRFQGSINHTAGYTAMPYNQPKLNACTVNRINAWINAGMP